MKKMTTKVIAEIAIFAAIGTVLDIVQGFYTDFIPVFNFGGSVGVAMIAVFIISYRHGLLPGLLCGFLMGMIDLMNGFYAISDEWYKVFSQVALDYWLGYTVVGIAGMFSSKLKSSETKKQGIIILSIACFVGAFAKFFCHFLSGVIFWPSEDMNAVLYSIIYNGGYMLPSFILTLALTIVIYLKAPFILTNIEE